MDIECTKEKIREALRIFISRDKNHLLKVNIYEPTISHRIALYLEGLFSEFNIDCEYNKNLDDYKKNSNGKNIRPDIIIHNRNSSNNIAIIEVKKNGINSILAQKDIEKLQGCMEGTLNYNLGVFIGVLKCRIDICWIEKMNEQIITISEILPN